jgi:hypothetical protein
MPWLAHLAHVCYVLLQLLPCLQVAAALPNRADVLLLMGAICYQLKDYQQCIAYNDR